MEALNNWFCKLNRIIIDRQCAGFVEQQFFKKIIHKELYRAYGLNKPPPPPTQLLYFLLQEDIEIFFHFLSNQPKFRYLSFLKLSCCCLSFVFLLISRSIHFCKKYIQTPLTKDSMGAVSVKSLSYANYNKNLWLTSYYYPPLLLLLCSYFVTCNISFDMSTWLPF